MKSKSTPRARDKETPPRRPAPHPSPIERVQATVNRHTAMLVRITGQLEEIGDTLARLEPIEAVGGETELPAAPAGEADTQLELPTTDEPEAG